MSHGRKLCCRANPSVANTRPSAAATPTRYSFRRNTFLPEPCIGCIGKVRRTQSTSHVYPSNARSMGGEVTQVCANPNQVYVHLRQEAYRAYLVVDVVGQRAAHAQQHRVRRQLRRERPHGGAQHRVAEVDGGERDRRARGTPRARAWVALTHAWLALTHTWVSVNVHLGRGNTHTHRSRTWSAATSPG